MNNKDNDNISKTIAKMMKSDEKDNNNNKEEQKNNDVGPNSSENDDLCFNSDCSKKSYQSMFSIISKKDSDFINLEKSDSSTINNYQLNDLNMSQQSESSINSNNTISFWEALKLKLNNIKNQIIFNYNIFSTSNNLKYTSPSPKLIKEIQIFDEKYLDHEKLLNRLKNIPWFSYRKDFDQIKEKEDIYTTDAGWGCMLRVSQMILAQGICNIHSVEKLSDFINQYLSYFYDNKIPLKYMCKNEKEKLNNNKNSNEITLDDFEIIENVNEKEISNSFIDFSCEIIKGLENYCQRNINKEYITPPYSIRNLMKVQKQTNKDGKKAGQWFSNYDTMRLISIITKDMNEKNDCDFKVINCNEGTIYIEDIIKQCFEESQNSDNSEEFEILHLSSSVNSETRNDDIDDNRYFFNDKLYKFKDKFLLFVSVRHGLYSLDEQMYDEVLKIFDIDTNIGFIGGKNSRAFYFIGKCENNVIFLDPHYVQSTLPIIQLGTISVKDSYIPNDIYYMPVDELSPSFTIGFAVKNIQNFKKLMKKIYSSDWINSSKCKSEEYKNGLFTVKSFHYYNKLKK